MDTLQLYFLFVALGAFIGVLVTPLVFWAKGRKPASGFFVGVFFGVLGNLILLIPLWLLVKPVRRVDRKFDLTVAYNLGVASVLGNRREEARYYFIQVTQADPDRVDAWLYLANLATSPMEAWSFIQQARATAPANPSVQQAVSVVWPQVQHQFSEGYNSMSDSTPIPPPIGRR